MTIFGQQLCSFFLLWHCCDVLPFILKGISKAKIVQFHREAEESYFFVGISVNQWEGKADGYHIVLRNVNLETFRS